MDKRIRIVWLLSIVTMALIFVINGYWITKQYTYSAEERFKAFKTDCDSILNQEFNIRQASRRQYTMEARKEHHPYISYNVLKFKIQDKDENDKDTLKWPYIEVLPTYYDGNDDRSFIRSMDSDSLRANYYKEKRIRTYLRGLTELKSHMVMNYADVALTSEFNPAVVDSLLQTKGYGKMHNLTYSEYSTLYYPAVYSVSGFFRKTVTVIYSHNPLFRQGVKFYVDIPIKPMLLGMVWPLLGSGLLLIVLAFCLTYQLKTILIQRRIDGLRHEFLKNMVLELKQPPTEPSKKENGIHIGHTDFYYELNELRHKQERVILTSRQAEILHILCQTPNEMVTREKILIQAWGDDSYSNSLALNVQISYLRRALSSDETVSIEALYKKGYVLRVIT